MDTDSTDITKQASESEEEPDFSKRLQIFREICNSNGEDQS